MSVKKAPRYDSFKPSSTSASFAKHRNKAKNTTPEVLLRRALWTRGVRYRLYVRQLPGKPDIVFPKERVIVFIDGDFWHGRNWEELEKKLRYRANAEYWIAKILYNRARDNEQTQMLEHQGWIVMRVWETDVIHNLKETVELVIATIRGDSHLDL